VVIPPQNTPQKKTTETLAAQPHWNYIGPADTIDFEWQIGRWGVGFAGDSERKYGTYSQPASTELKEFAASLPAISLSPLSPRDEPYDCEILFKDKFEDLRVIVENCVRIVEEAPPPPPPSAQVLDITSINGKAIVSPRDGFFFTGYFDIMYNPDWTTAFTDLGGALAKMANGRVYILFFMDRWSPGYDSSFETSITPYATILNRYELPAELNIVRRNVIHVVPHDVNGMMTKLAEYISAHRNSVGVNVMEKYGYNVVMLTAQQTTRDLLFDLLWRNNKLPTATGWEYTFKIQLFPNAYSKLVTVNGVDWFIAPFILPQDYYGAAMMPDFQNTPFPMLRAGSSESCRLEPLFSMEEHGPGGIWSALIEFRGQAGVYQFFVNDLVDTS